jgi:hypothetical protein
MEHWEHATVVVDSGKIELVSGGGATVVDSEGGTVRRAVSVLDDLAPDG